MAKQRQQSIKKTKPISKKTLKSAKGKKAAAKHGCKLKKSDASKRSCSTKSSSSSSLIKRHVQHKRQTNKTKQPSKFNLYMRKALPQIKQDHPGIANKDAFKKAAEQWAASSDNPKNKHH